MRQIGLFLSIILVASPAAGELAKVGQVNHWEIYKDSDQKNCTMGATYEDDEVIIISYYAENKSSQIVFTEREATSLADGDKRKINIQFVDGKTLDDGWTDLEFTASVRKNGGRMLESRGLEPPFLEDVAEASIIGFTYGDKLIASFDLSGSAKAVEALKKCSMEAAGINPRDPFAN